MIKLVCFLKRKPGMDRDAFHRHWLESHGPLIAKTPELAKHLLRYEQNHRLDADYDRDPDGFDGVTVQWFDAMDDFLGFCQSSAYGELIAPDEARFLDRSGFAIIFAGPANRVIVDPSAREAAELKLLCLLSRKSGTSAADYRAHWHGPHAAIFRDTPDLAPHIASYEQHPRGEADYARDEGAGDDERGFDGMAEQWFANSDALGEFMRSPSQVSLLRPDEDRFMDRSRLLWFVGRAADVIVAGAGRDSIETGGAS